MAETATLSLALREQYASEEQQRRTSEFGMWVFLATEVLFFGGLFTAYAVYRMYYPQAFAAGGKEMELSLGAINTVVLLCSSYTMVLAVHSAQIGRRGLLVFFLIATICIGMVFLGIKFTEYYLHWEHHKVPGPAFQTTFSNPGREQIFFLLYFIMTGLHAVHMIIGVGLLTVLTVRAARDVFTPEYYTPVEVTGLYWHFVDVIWLFLFALLYLIDRHG